MATRKPHIIGIAGGSGSGKTSFIHAVMQSFTPDQIALVSQDNYYLPEEAQQLDANGRSNFDLPESIDRKRFERDMNLLLGGKPITKIEYTFNNNARQAKTIHISPAPVILAEGLFVFHYPEINNLLDYKVYLDADETERLWRRIRRDWTERGYPEKVVRYQWENHVIPAEKKFLEQHKPEADLLIDNTKSFEADLKILIKHINNILTN